MDPQSSSENIALLILLLLSIVFSGSETALTSLTKMKLRTMLDNNIKGSKKVEKIMYKPKKLLTTILIGNNIVNITASALTTSIIINKFKGDQKSILMGTATLTLIILIFGEIIPKNVAKRKSEKISILVAPFIQVCMIIFIPVEFILNFISDTIIKILGGNSNDEEVIITEDELKTIVGVSHEEGVIEDKEKEMINNIFDFGDSTAREIMIPRTEIIAVPKTISYDDLVKLFKEEKISRIPVYEESIDDIIGILYIKDVIFLKESKSFNLFEHLRDVFYTYESKLISELFTDMRIKRSTLTIVVDEYGGTAGLVTSHDLIEEIFGDIHDEDDEVDEEIKKVSENEFEVDGTIKLDDFEEITNISIITDEFETLGGFVIGLFGYIPKIEEEIISTKYNIKFRIEEMERNRLDKVRVTIL